LPTSKQNIGQNVSSLLKESVLDAESVVKNYFTTAAETHELGAFSPLPTLFQLSGCVVEFGGCVLMHWMWQ
jgi:hypothetical protein